VVSDRATLAPLLSTLRDLTRWFEAEDVSYAVIGGVAASLLATPRLTRDVDAVVLHDRDPSESFLAAGRSFGFEPRQPDTLEFAHKTRVLLLRHEASGIDTDISFGALPFERESVERARRVDVAGISLALPAPEDLIVMKAVAHRMRDLIDVEEITRAHPQLDRRRVRRWVAEFSRVLEMPEILQDLETILERNPGGRR
jgi:predicted nucleotidyltransferase